jgi:membrane fusion protein (multidrug efflux system)
MRLRSFILLLCLLSAAKPQGGFPVEAAQVRADKLIVALSTVGTLKANESLTLKPEIAGRIEAIHFEEGAVVKKGAPLISLDNRIIAAQLKQAEAALGLARANYARAKMLKEKGAGTISNFDMMQAGLSVAQAQVDLASATLDRTNITAPFDGVMGLRHISPGDVVSIGQEIAGFQSVNPMKAEFTLPENATSAVAAGQMIDVQIDALPGRTFSGKIYAIDPQINESSRNILLRALIPNDDGALKPGLFARINIITAQKENALFVPESAIVPRGNDSFVMRVGADKKITTIKVDIGERKNGDVEITGGLSANDTVVTAGHLKLRDGMEVSVMPTESTGEKK